MVAALALALIVVFLWPLLQAAFTVALLLAVALLPAISPPLHAVRSFFGTHRVVDTGGGDYRILLHGKLFSPFFDFNEPPFFKHFLRLDLSGGALRIRCYGLTGYRRHEVDPPLWDEVTIDLNVVAGRAR